MREERLTVMEDAMKRATCRGVGAQRRPAHPLSLQHCLPNGILPYCPGWPGGSARGGPVHMALLLRIVTHLCIVKEALASSA